MQTNHARKIAGILIISPENTRTQEITRVTSHLNPTFVERVDSVREATHSIYPQTPELIIIDLSGVNEFEYLSKVEPFVLSLPGGIKTVLLEPEPTVSKVVKASEMGISVMLRSISSHYSVNALMNEFRNSPKQL